MRIGLWFAAMLLLFGTIWTSAPLPVIVFALGLAALPMFYDALNPYPTPLPKWEMPAQLTAEDREWLNHHLTLGVTEVTPVVLDLAAMDEVVRQATCKHSKTTVVPTEGDVLVRVCASCAAPIHNNFGLTCTSPHCPFCAYI